MDHGSPRKGNGWIKGKGLRIRIKDENRVLDVCFELGGKKWLRPLKR